MAPTSGRSRYKENEVAARRNAAFRPHERRREKSPLVRATARHKTLDAVLPGAKTAPESYVF